MSLISQLKAGKAKLAVVGLGYVGLPLAVEFGKVAKTIGFDISAKRIASLKKGQDTNDDVPSTEIQAARHLEYTDNPKRLKEADLIAVAVPTPVTESKQPDLSYVESATRIVGQNLKKGAVVVFEPTVYPGVTEEFCVPILEKESGLKYKKDFKVGYSPERVVPGDRERTIPKIIKIVSGCDAESLETIAAVYGLIIKAGIHKASSIKVAEAAKVIENTQRDLNIALMNELALIFNKMDIDTRDVIEAAGTKWNFNKYYPGLVGGHCISVDPYYLTHKAEQLGYHPQVILSGRRVNDYIPKFIAEETVRLMIKAQKKIKGSKVLVLGVTFKENVADIRDSRVFGLIWELERFDLDITVCDPHADAAEVLHESGLKLSTYSPTLKTDAIVLAVSHAALIKALVPVRIKKHCAGKSGVFVDVKGALDRKAIEKQGLLYWRL